MLFSFNSSLLFRCFCMFQWLGSELCLEFFILYYTVHAILYSTARSAWGSGPRILYFQHCNICSCWEACLPWNDGLSLNTFSVSYWCHMTVFLLYFGYTSWRIRAASIRFTTLLCLLSPPCPYLGYQKCCWTYWMWPRLFGPLHLVFHRWGDWRGLCTGFSCQLSVGLRWVLYMFSMTF